MSGYILAIDQGTTSSRVIIFDKNCTALVKVQAELSQHFPRPGWVEHDPEQIWQQVLQLCKQALQTANIDAAAIAALAITNQRETTVVWEKATGKAIYPAIVWQDRRTADYCKQLMTQNIQTMLQLKTGLLLDPYFSATKINWILNNVTGAKRQAENGELLFGTIDAFLIWRLSNGAAHATDVTNASRTLLFNINTLAWDNELLELFDVPEALLPVVKDNTDQFGIVASEHLGAAIPIIGVAGDQQAAMVGQACLQPGMIKSTYGTGCFMLMNTGAKVVTSKNHLLTTVGARIKGKTHYALEGSIFIAGAAVQWLRDAVKLIHNAKETETLVTEVADNAGVYLVPAFTGLGAPFWDPDARGAILGLSRDTGVAHIVRAALEAVCYQSNDLLQAMIADGAPTPNSICVDGGMVNNDWLMQFLADILQVKVERPFNTESTALGAAYLAALALGYFADEQYVMSHWQVEKEFEPQIQPEARQLLYKGWLAAVARVRT